MKYDPEKHRRRSIRLKDYDYSLEGAYYVTICIQERLCLFGNVLDDAMVLDYAGRMIENVLKEIPARFENVEILDYVIMPNHIHIIVRIESKKSVGVPLVGTLDRYRMENVHDHHDRVDDNGTDNKTDNGTDNKTDNGTDNKTDNDEKRVPTRGTPTTK